MSIRTVIRRSIRRVADEAVNRLLWSTPWAEVLLAAALGAIAGYSLHAHTIGNYYAPSSSAGLVSTSTTSTTGASAAAPALSEEAQLNALAVQWARDLGLPNPQAVCRRVRRSSYPDCNLSASDRGLWALHCDLEAGYCFFLGNRR